MVVDDEPIIADTLVKYSERRGAQCPGILRR